MKLLYWAILVSVLIGLAPTAPVSAGITPDQKCASSKMKAVGKKYAAKAKCYAKAMSKSLPVDAACLSLAESKFDAAFAKADDKGGCLHEGDAPVIEAKIDACLEDVVGDIGCGNGVQEGDEACDDGNTISGDGCSASCETEAPCTADGGLCATAVECCSSLCTGGACQASCAADGAACLVGGDCCSGVCSANTCQFVCVADGGTCVVDSECCSNNCIGGACVP